jgi:hypothetical protein
MLAKENRNRGMELVQVAVIIVVAVAIAIIFKGQIAKLLSTIFKNATSDLSNL